MFPGRSAFRSLNWSNGSNAGNVVGEVIGAPRPWSNGATPECVAGNMWWGNYDEFTRGVDHLLEEPWSPNACGLPEQCPVTVACQPWYYTDYGLRVVHTLGYTDTWTVVNTFPDIFQATGPMGDDDVIEAHPGTGPCAPGDLTILSCRLRDYPDIGEMILESYDPDTSYGTWIPSPDVSAPVGFKVLFYCPP